MPLGILGIPVSYRTITGPVSYLTSHLILSNLMLKINVSALKEFFVKWVLCLLSDTKFSFLVPYCGYASEVFYWKKEI